MDKLLKSIFFSLVMIGLVLLIIFLFAGKENDSNEENINRPTHNYRLTLRRLSKPRYNTFSHKLTFDNFILSDKYIRASDDTNALSSAFEELWITPYVVNSQQIKDHLDTILSPNDFNLYDEKGVEVKTKISDSLYRAIYIKEWKISQSITKRRF